MTTRILPTASSPVYYVYMLLDDRDPTTHKYGKFKFPAKPLYCGMGYNGRADIHVRNALGSKLDSKTQKNIRIRNIVKATGKSPTVAYVKRGLTQQEAYDLERKLVVLIGRLNKNTGPLTNLSDGGEGQKNVVHTPEYRARRSQINRSWWESKTEDEVKKSVAKRLLTMSRWTEEERRDYFKKRGVTLVKTLAAETPAQKKARTTKCRKTCAARTEEERAELSAKLRGGRKRFLDGLTDLEYFEFHAQVTEARSKTYDAMSDADKKKIKKARSASMQEHWDGLSKKDRTVLGSLISAGLNAMSPKAKKARSKNISTALVAAYAADTKIKKRAAKANSETRAGWSAKQKRDYAASVSAGHAERSDEAKAKSSKKMSKSGLARVAAMTDKEQRKLQKALSLALTNHHQTLTAEERSARISKGHLSKDHAAINSKIARSTIEAHARMSTRDKLAKAERIRQTLLARPPEVMQRLAAGNMLRGALRRAGHPVNHPRLRPKLDQLVAATPWNGKPVMMDRFTNSVNKILGL